MNINIRLLDHLIAMAEANRAIALKNDAVRRQDFEAAVTFREQEVAAIEKMMHPDELKQLREELIHDTPVEETKQ